MLMPADAAVVARDSALPGLGLLLDTDRFGELLQQHFPALAIESVQPTYLRYKPGTSCLVNYQLHTQQQKIDLYARAYRFNAQCKLDKAQQKMKQASNLNDGTYPETVIINNLATVIQRFPQDRRLTVLPRLATPEAKQPLFTKLLPNQAHLWNAELHTLRYKPERRYVAQLVTEAGPQAVLKAYNAYDYPLAKKGAKAFKAGSALTLAKQLGRSNRHRLLVFEWVAGQSLYDLLPNRTLNPEAINQVGRALGQLHQQDTPHLPTSSPDRESQNLLAIAKSIAAVSPNLANQAMGLAAKLAYQLTQESPEQYCDIHGDFSADQVILATTGPAFLDFDNAIQADPAADLGSFMAQVERDTITGRLLPCLAEGIRLRLLAGYRLETGTYFPKRVNLYTAIGLLKRAPHAFRNRDPFWPERTQAILTRAEEVITHG